MAKAVVYALLAAAFLVLLLSGPSNRRHHNHPRLNRRLGDKFHAPTFDPLVAKIERYAEEKGFKIEDDVDSTINTIRNDSFFGEVVNDGKEYFSNEGRLNITLRLVILFPLLDKAPRDGVISPLELNSWLTDMAVERLNYRTQKELASHDSNGDKAISFREYLSQLSDEDIEKNGMGHGEAGWWKQQFDNADFDRNGTLSFDEFKDFLHPEDSDNKEIKKWLLKEKLERMDYDKDERLSFVEFCDHTYDIYKNYVEYEIAPGRRVPKPEEKFAELDLDKDRYLTVEELIPILGYLHPGELSYAKYYSSYLIHEADDNKDGKLTLDEMLNHEYIFYSTVYDDSHEDYEEDSRDEL